MRPHLEYCVQIWCPYLAWDMDVLERVQMPATKLVREFVELPYKLSSEFAPYIAIANVETYLKLIKF